MAEKIEQVSVPNIGGATNVDVIEIFVKPGDIVEKDAALISLEGDKATMDVPAPKAGRVKDIQVKVGDKVSEGSAILTFAIEAETKEKPTEKTVEKPEIKSETKPTSSDIKPDENLKHQDTMIHAGPAVRRIAYEFDINLSEIKGTGEKDRITKEDLQQFVKSRLKMANSPSNIGLNITPPPQIDFASFGQIEKKDLSKIQKISGANLHRNWVSIPHVTQFGEADITELEAFRLQQKSHAENQGVRLTAVVFLMKAVVVALKAFPHFNASLDNSGETLILKKYFHIGVAVDTPKGLVVPVIRDVDKKGLFALAKELGEISKKAREKGLSMADMQGGCFSISSLGGIGGTAFTPIINAPEVAILGVSRAQTKGIYRNDHFEPRLMLPLSLSYDHRVIDGADGARFMVYLSECLTDIRTLLF